MKLSDMLSYADISQLSSIAKRYDCECNGNSKHELIQSILANVHRKEVINHSIEQLDIVELRFLNFLLFEANKPYSLEDLLAMLQSCTFDKVQRKVDLINQRTRRGSNKKAPTEATPREMISGFKSNGWLFNGFTNNDRYLFHMPTDFKMRYRQLLLAKLHREVTYCEQPKNITNESGLLLTDLNTMLHYIRNNNPTASADGVLHRRAILQLNEACSIQEEMPSKGAWKFGYGLGFGELPDRLTLMYDFLWSKRRIEQIGEQIVVNQANDSKLVVDDLMILINHWLRRYRTPIPNIRALVYWVIMLGMSWCSTESLLRIFVPFIKPYYFDTAEDIFMKRVIKPLKHIGIIQVGVDPEFGEVIQTTRYGQIVVKELYE